MVQRKDMLLISNSLLQPQRCGGWETLVPRSICEKAEEFVFQEETDYFENTFSTKDFISMMWSDQWQNWGGEYSRVLDFWKGTNSGMKMAGSVLFWVIFQPLPNYEVL